MDNSVVIAWGGGSGGEGRYGRINGNEKNIYIYF